MEKSLSEKGKVMTNTEKEQVISMTRANMALEGMYLTENEEQFIKDCLNGKSNFDEEIQKTVNYWRR